MKVYLAGGVNNLTGREVTSWRQEAKEKLKARNIEYIDPTRGRIKFDDQLVTDAGADVSDNTTVVRAKNDIKKSDVLLVEMMNESRPYVGTSMEILYAWQMDMPIIVCSEYENSFLNYHSTAIFSRLEDCIEFIALEFA